MGTSRTSEGKIAGKKFSRMLTAVISESKIRDFIKRNSVLPVFSFYWNLYYIYNFKFAHFFVS